jgi:hypothetical protein
VDGWKKLVRMFHPGLSAGTGGRGAVLKRFHFLLKIMDGRLFPRGLEWGRVSHFNKLAIFSQSQYICHFIVSLYSVTL